MKIHYDHKKNVHAMRRREERREMVVSAIGLLLFALFCGGMAWFAGGIPRILLLVLAGVFLVLALYVAGMAVWFDPEEGGR